MTLYCLQDHDDFANIRTALLAGYRCIRLLTPEHEAFLEAFIAMRTLQDMFWIIEERDQPEFHDSWHTLIIKQLQALEAW